MTMQNGHDTNFHILHPTDNGICHAKLIEVHPSNIFWGPLLAEIFNCPISAGTYYGQRVATSVLCDANWFEIGPLGRYATLLKRLYWNLKLIKMTKKHYVSYHKGLIKLLDVKRSIREMWARIKKIKVKLWNDLVARNMALPKGLQQILCKYQLRVKF